MRTPTPLKKPSTASSTRHSTGSVLVARPSAAQTPATYRPLVGRTSFSGEKPGPSAAPNHGGGADGGGCSPPAASPPAASPPAASPPAASPAAGSPPARCSLFPDRSPLPG